MAARLKMFGLALLALSTLGGIARADALNPHRLSLGDGRVSDAPRQGYVFACEQQFMPGRGGAAETVPWIHGRTWDAATKPHVEGKVMWPDARLRVVTRGAWRIITGNGLPVATPTGRFPVSPDDPAYRYDRNPNSIRAHRVRLRLPRDPRFAARPACVPMGPIGIALNGVMIFNALDAGGRDAVAHEVQDRCNGHPQQQGVYHYHGPSPCLPQARGRARIIGYALDGFPITGINDANGHEPTDAELDACHGRVGRIRRNGRWIRIYHYVLTRDYPYTIGCFRGTPIRMPRGPGGPGFRPGGPGFGPPPFGRPGGPPP
jgi:YHYH protein